MTTVAQHVDTRAQRIWIECCEQEKKLRLKWFIVNQQNIEKLSQSVPRNEKNIALQNEVNAKRVDIYRNANRYIRKPKPDIDIINYEVDENVMLNPMKPVDQELQDIFYEGIKKVLYGTDENIDLQVPTVPEIYLWGLNFFHEISEKTLFYLCKNDLAEMGIPATLNRDNRFSSQIRKIIFRK